MKYRAFNPNYESNETYIRATATAKGYIKQFIKNNKHLLKQHKRSLASQIREINSTGIRLTHSYYEAMQQGRVKPCSISYLCFFADYWNISLADLIGRDFEQEVMSKAINVSGEDKALIIPYESLENVKPVTTGEALPIYYIPDKDE